MFVWKRRAPHLAAGRRGEQLAIGHLRRHGYRILEKNFRCKMGEIDIIAEDNGVLVFVEVKARSEPALADPLCMVTKRKSTRVINASRFFLAKHDVRDLPCRFDVVGVSLGRPIQISLVRGAFDLSKETPPWDRKGRKMRGQIFPTWRKE